MRRYAVPAIALIAISIGIVALLVDPAPPEVEDFVPDVLDTNARRADALTSPDTPKGGVYAGFVVNEQGTPVADAPVRLVSYNAGTKEMFARAQKNLQQFDPAAPIPVIGDFRIAGEARTDAAGWFKIAASPRDLVTHVLAWHANYFLNVVPVKGPGEDKRIVLKPAGKVIGRIVDAETDRPVPHARVDLYLQQITALAPEYDPGGGGMNRGRKGKKVDRSEIAVLGHLLAKHLGEAIWGIPYRGTEALRFMSDANGHFEIGPLGDSVQLEFVITHDDYKWSDHDTLDGTQRAKRTVVHPGETVHRTFKLLRGGEIAGRVVDETTGEGVPEVVVSASNIVKYKRHWWYDFKTRSVKTDANGAFRIAGLSLGRQAIELSHPSFGREFVPDGAMPGEKELEFHIPRLGSIAAVFTGMDARPPGGRIYVNLEPTKNNEGSRTLSRMKRERKQLGTDGGVMNLPKIRPGEYELWVEYGDRVSETRTVVVRPLEKTDVTLALGGTGAIQVDVTDTRGRIVDPVTMRLVQLTGDRSRRMGTFTSRGGAIEAFAVKPGRYTAEFEGQGLVKVTTKPFDVGEGETVKLDRVEMASHAYIRILSILDDRRRTPEGQITLEMRAGDGKWIPLYLTGQLVPVTPGPVTVRGKTDKGLKFEKAHEIESGAVWDLEVVLQ